MPTSWKRTTAPSTASTTAPSASHDVSRKSDSADSAEFVAEVARRAVADLVLGRRQAKQIDVALSLVRNHHTLFESWNLKAIEPYRQGISVNLFGPPGTGKSHCAEALAHELGKLFLSVNYAELVSKYVGDTQKNIVAAFRAAAASGAVLFFDEADAMLRRRSASSGQGADESANLSRSVLLRELDRFVGVVVFATNRAEDYDQAFVRRMLAHIEFELPDLVTREAIWDRLLVPELPMAKDVSRSALASSSEGLSGGDIVNVIIGAAATAVGREDQTINGQDLSEAIAKIRDATAKVGTSQGRSRPVVEEATVSLVDAPEDVRNGVQKMERIA